MREHRGLQFAGMFLAASLSPLGSTMIAVALPSIGRELHVPGGALTSWLVASYLIAGIAAMGPCGKIGDRIGHRRSLTIGMSVYGAGSAVGFLVATLPTLAFARIAMAVGGALVVPATMALLRNSVPEERRPRTFGWFGSVMGMAAAIGPLLGGELVARFGWRAVFVANLPVILVAFALLRLGSRAAPTARESPAPQSRFDIEGSALLASSLTLLVAATRMKSTLVPWTVAAGLVLAIAFVWWERRVAAPVLDLALFARRPFAAGNAVVGLQNLAMYALLFQLPIFFEQVRGIPSGTTGRTLIGMMIAMVVFAPVGGRLAERFGARIVGVLGSVVSLAGVLLLVDFVRLARPVDALAGLVLVGTGLGLATAPSQAVAMSAVEPGRAGMAGGALSTSRYLGGVIGISLLGSLLRTDAGVISHREAALAYAVALAISVVAAALLPGRRITGLRVGGQDRAVHGEEGVAG